MKLSRGIMSMVFLAMWALSPAAAGSETEKAVYVVRFADRITDESRAAVEEAGARVIDYEPRDGYLVWADSDQARDAERLSAVLSVRRMPAGRKLSPALPDRSGGIRADVTIYHPALEETRAALDSLGQVLGSGLAGSDGTRTTLAVELSGRTIAAAADLPGVLYVAPGITGVAPLDEMSDQVLAGNIEPGTNRPVIGYADWLDEVGLDGTGVKVAVVDSGISPLHPDLEGRVERPVDYGPPGAPGDRHFHGTHVAGIIGGDPPHPLGDPDGFVYGQGVAPAARLLDQNAFAWPVGTDVADILDEIVRGAWDAGARMSNNSWEGVAEGRRPGYTALTRAADVLARDADPSTPGMQEYLFIFGAGNSGGQGMGQPQEAKNIITVGSTNSGRGIGYPLETSPSSTSTFTSQGPTRDGRVYPTISAPGGNVVSARAPESVFAPGFCTAPLDGAALYATCSGTSMAAPHASGAAALVHQWWSRETGDLPSPAMVKSLLVNGALGVTPPDIPNHEEGWGRINLGNDLFEGLPPLWEDQEVVLSGPAQEASWVIDVTGSGALKATLGWSDAPGAVGADPALVNDLDLVVERVDGQEAPERWLGNALVEGRSVPGDIPDRLNNLENVLLLDPEPGSYRITVRAHNLPGDGIPENADPTDQDFSLVVRGGATVAERPSLRSPIQPGIRIRIDGDSLGRGETCTLGWLLDRFVEVPDPASGEPVAEREGVYATVADSCITEEGREVFMMGALDESPDKSQRIGRVAFRDQDLGYGFVRIDDANLDHIDPSMKGHPDIPTGVSTAASSSSGDLIRVSGHGLGFHAHEATQEQRSGTLTSNDGTTHGVVGLTLTNGDHGAPVADVSDGNTALGMMTIPEGWLFPVTDGVTGLSLEGLLADARERGWDMRLLTAGNGEKPGRS